MPIPAHQTYSGPSNQYLNQMKYHGSKFEYEQQRDEDLMRAYRQALHESSHIHMPDIFRKVVAMPSSRFWVSEERAAVVISAMMRGVTFPNMNPTKRKMFQEIYNRVVCLRDRQPCLSVYELTFEVVRQQAPQFYLTPGSAKVIISKIKKRKREKKQHS